MLFLVTWCLLFIVRESVSEIEVIFVSNSSEFDIQDRSTSDCGCGWSLYGTDACRTTNRIVGGAAVRPNELPWQALLYICTPGYSCNVCGGSLINKRYVLTAAHCMFQAKNVPVAAKDIEVRLGEHDTSSTTDNTYLQVFGVEQIVLNGYDPVLVNNDIALLRLNKDVIFTNGVRPVCLPSTSSITYVGAKAWVSGWGYLSEGGKSLSSTLQKVGLNIIENSNQYCKNGAKTGVVVPDISKLCAYDTLKDACQGDSGGPLVTLDTGRCTLTGIVSYGIGCARAFHAGVYTRATNYLSWIRTQAASGGCFGNTTPLLCDLRCTSIGTSTGKYKINGYICSCNGGYCSADDTSVNICTLLGNPCQSTSGGLPCSTSNQCDCRQVLTNVYGNPSQPEIVKYTLAGIEVTCSSRTGYCCDTLYPNQNLCTRLNTVLGGTFFV